MMHIIYLFSGLWIIFSDLFFTAAQHAYPVNTQLWLLLKTSWKSRNGRHLSLHIMGSMLK
ncbi:hypothetical protein DYD83_07990 [Dickeya fangzhongdai]|uniref:Uncharacterized protein n=1 Tax=Dickeya fangzhongdai TaxID=1778540 RepID=A0A2K8QK82_9GAMM|nr:hypothetical protein CVE23_07945 [Dickeya fangzhongdai]QOH47342.1 hypothetical protein DYD82_07990 [Dickeya fangzhongdai]QOH51648.1 hypothetical protein DYD83_07990 [Dickeya fangzhongdai]